MLGYHQPRDPHVHGLPSRRRTMSERSMTDSHGQPGILLTLSSVRSRRHSYHSQADSTGSIPVTPPHANPVAAVVDSQTSLFRHPSVWAPFRTAERSVGQPLATDSLPALSFRQWFSADEPTDPPLRAATGQSKQDGSERRRHKEAGLVI